MKKKLEDFIGALRIRVSVLRQRAAQEEDQEQSERLITDALLIEFIIKRLEKIYNESK